ncbi:DnaJ-domain-containing protein [Ascoidea rubescens DSM 1968]|uniref:DnaJ-domain-containing protein n=1 Tax=Ascoidea rubescens DSM 1968 TaxID=1344418 RepID=A0A1D2VJB0_9ASCO|nr:DnaJ-domain-containing protein [Ascoidea rubescens DSM 1968]ODV61708.1 DnaJ-domain-containing protein [Ascoidea rubescens DSM 1968]
MRAFGRLIALLVMFNLVLVSLVNGQETDLYKVLDVPRDASDKDIKKAYRVLSKKYHPDKNPNDELSHQKFIEIGEAYEILSDSEKRQVYDNYGYEAVKNGQNPNQQQQQHDPFDFFQHMFGGNRGNQKNVRKQKGQNIQVNIELTLNEYYNGDLKEYQINLKTVCDHCHGTASEDGKEHKCNECNGSGLKVIKRQLGPGMFQTFQTTCPKCQGKGKLIKNYCKKCNGQGIIDSTKSFNIHVSPGVDRHHVQVFENQANQYPDKNIIPGDLLFQFNENYSKNNLGYRRRGNNLFRTEYLSLKEALLGNWKRQLDFFNKDEPVHIKRIKNQIVTNDEIEIIKNKGMPIPESDDQFGDLYIQYKIIMPVGLKNPHDEF